jgi:hypothetical protein
LLMATPVLIDFVRTTRYVYCDVAWLPVFTLLLLIDKRSWFIAGMIFTFVLYTPFWDVPLWIEWLRSFCSVLLTGYLLSNVVSEAKHLNFPKFIRKKSV